MRFARPITIRVRRVESDAFGEETVRAVFTVPGCALAQQSTGETPGDRRNEVTTRLRLLAPASADLHAGDEIELPEGRRFRLRGDPAAPRSPFTGWRPGLVIDIDEVRG